MNINFELYKVFYYVAKNSSISRAANEMMISQPAISKSIKILEEQVGLHYLLEREMELFYQKQGKLFIIKLKMLLNL